MSVEHCVVRVTLQVFEQIQKEPDRLKDLMDEFHMSLSAAGLNKTSIDSREAVRGRPIYVPESLRILYVDEFTTSLLVDFMQESSAFFKALAGWGDTHILTGVRYGYGDVAYYFPEEVKQVGSELHASPDVLLETRFRDGAENFRIAAAGYFKDDPAILAHQRLFAGFLRKFYNEAAQESNFVLLLTL